MMTTTSAAATTTGASSSPTASGKVRFAGVNIAGFDFGCSTDGSFKSSDMNPPIPPPATSSGSDGPGQMAHFVKDDGMNIFRLPVAWQYLVNNNLGGALDSTASALYDRLVQSCLGTGSSCIIDIHNYARWNGAIVGQGGPSNAQLASLWSQLATKYKSQPNVIFGIMNEPHDLPSVPIWGQTVQDVVTAIRGTGATQNLILLPGNDFTSAGSFISDGSLAALSQVKNPDGTTTGLIFDVHKYLDSDNSGTTTECVMNNIASAFQPLAAALRSAGRQALLSETGGGNTGSCESFVCQQIAYLNQNSDVYLGYVAWAAGSFSTTYPLTLTPTNNGGSWTDQPLLKQCFAR